MDYSPKSRGAVVGESIIFLTAMTVCLLNSDSIPDPLMGRKGFLFCLFYPSKDEGVVFIQAFRKVRDILNCNIKRDKLTFGPLLLASKNKSIVFFFHFVFMYS